MNDTFVMSSAFLDSLRPPLGCVGAGCRRPAFPTVRCCLCGESLIEIEFPKHFALVCDNTHCSIFRQPQGCRAKNPSPKDEAPRSNPGRLFRSSYTAYLEQKRHNYRALCSLGIPAKEAGRLASNKQTRFLLEQYGQCKMNL